MLPLLGQGSLHGYIWLHGVLESDFFSLVRLVKGRFQTSKQAIEVLGAALVDRLTPQCTTCCLQRLRLLPSSCRGRALHVHDAHLNWRKLTLSRMLAGREISSVLTRSSISD